METRHRFLGPDEVIQEGDEIVLPNGIPIPACNGIGNTPSKRGKVYRRPIPPVDPLFLELVEALAGMVEKWCNLVNSGDAGFWDPEKEEEIIKSREILAKSRAALTIYETVDGKAVHRE